MKVIKIGITGHRSLADEVFVEEAIAKVISKILLQNGVETFEAITGLAYGADTLFARIAKEKFNAKIKIMLPFSLNEYEKDFDSDIRIMELRRWCDQYPLEVLWPVEMKLLDRKERNEAYLNCGKKIVDACDYLIAVWNGKPSLGSSGTQIVVDYARSKQKKMDIIYAYKKGEITEKEISDLFNFKDQKALALKSKYEKYWRWGIVLGILAVYTLIIPLCFEVEKYYAFVFSILETMLVIATFAMANKVNHKDSNALRILSRIEAERLRVLMAFSKAKIPVTKLKGQMDDIAIKEYRNNAIPDGRLIQIENFLSVQSTNELEQAASIDSLMGLIDHQIEYHLHGKKITAIANHLRIENKLAKLLTYTFIIGIIIHLVATSINVFSNSFDTHLWHTISVCIILGIPPLFAGMELWKYFEEWERVLGDSVVLADFFQSQKSRLREHPDQIVSVANNIREVMYRENSTWKYLMSSKVMHGIA